MKKLSKKHKYMICVLLIGILFSVIIYVSDSNDSKIVENNLLYRNEFGQGDYEIDLVVSHDRIKDDMNLQISEREYSVEELDNLLEGVYEAIENELLNGNESLNQIRDDISLPLKIDGYPFDLRWSISDEEIIDRTGKLKCEEGCMKTHSLIATVALMYKDYRQLLNYELLVVPKEYEAEKITTLKIRRNINNAVDESHKSRVIELPSEYAGKVITYSERIPKNSVLMMILSFVLSVIIGICVEYDEKQKKQKIHEELEKEYVVFAEKMKLYMISGLTVRHAFFEIKKSLEVLNSGKTGELYKRISVVCNKYINGCMEEEIINEFGMNCEGSYRKLAYLLVVNLKKGNDKLIALMEEEVEKANIHRKENARKKGDEASIKLLFPMMSMLLIVMALIILPAYLDFN